MSKFRGQRYDPSKIDPNLMEFFRSAEFAELIHQASDLGVGELGQHHNLGLRATDAAPGGIVKKLTTDVDTLEEDLNDLETTVAGIISAGDEYSQENYNRIPNGSFNSWDASLIQVPDLPDGLPYKWGNFWSTGARGPIRRATGINARDSVALKWSPVDPLGSGQRIYNEAIRLDPQEKFSQGEVSCWLRSENAANPIKFTMDAYSANHDHPAPFDGTTTYTSINGFITIDHTDWRKYSFKFKGNGLQYHAFYFSLWSDAPGGQVGYIDECAYNNDLLSSAALSYLGPAGEASGKIPYGFNYYNAGGSRGWDVTDGLGAFDLGAYYFRGLVSGNPFWDHIADSQVYRGFPSTVKDTLDALLSDGGSVTGTVGFTAAANWSISSALYRIWSTPPVKLVHLRVVIQRTTSTLVIPVDGNISNIDVLTATPSGVAPPFAVGLSGYSTGPESQMLMQSDGSCQLGWVCPGANVVVGDSLSASGTYVVIT